MAANDQINYVSAKIMTWASKQMVTTIERQLSFRYFAIRGVLKITTNKERDHAIIWCNLDNYNLLNY